MLSVLIKSPADFEIITISKSEQINSIQIQNHYNWGPEAKIYMSTLYLEEDSILSFTEEVFSKSQVGGTYRIPKLSLFHLWIAAGAV